MAQLVFVHGVNTRRERDPIAFDRDTETRSRRFQSLCFPNTPIGVLNPYWGVFGADPAWGWASIPNAIGHGTTLGAAEGTTDGVSLLNAARTEFAAVVATLSVSDLESKAGDQASTLTAERYWLAASAYAEATPHPAWLNTVINDAAFLQRLDAEVSGWLRARPGDQALGAIGNLQNLGRRLTVGINDLANGPIVQLVRHVMTPFLAVFLGDVFHYLKEGPARSEIRRVVIHDIIAAAQAAGTEQPLILIAHSMGGIIVYDILSDPASRSAITEVLGRELVVDLLLTVGSQIGLFEELKSFSASDLSVKGPDQRLPSPPGVRRWWNVWDRLDPLSFVGAAVFKDIEDLRIDTVAGVANAHTAYFTSMLFYHRLAARLAQAGLVA